VEAGPGSGNSRLFGRILMVEEQARPALSIGHSIQFLKDLLDTVRDVVLTDKEPPTVEEEGREKAALAALVEDVRCFKPIESPDEL
jgi:hypothetical protein